MDKKGDFTITKVAELILLLLALVILVLFVAFIKGKLGGFVDAFLGLFQ